jgi:hypothetical protein
LLYAVGAAADCSNAPKLVVEARARS